MGRGAESIRPFREALPLEVRDYIGGEVRKPLPHKACSAGRRHKKGELGSVHLFKLVEAAGVRVFVRFANYDMPPYGRQPFPSGAGSAVTAAENKKGPLDIDSREGVASLSAIRGLRDTPTSCWRRRVLRPRD